MLEDRYYALEVFREVSAIDDWGNTDDSGNWQLNGTIKGFLQTTGGSFDFANQANVPLSSHTLYTDIGVDINIADRIKLNSVYYRVEFMQPNLGISGMVKHQEIGVNILNDL